MSYHGQFMVCHNQSEDFNQKKEMVYQNFRNIFTHDILFKECVLSPTSCHFRGIWAANNMDDRYTTYLCKIEGILYLNT